MAAKRRGFESLGDMARSLGIVLAVVLGIVLMTLRTPGQAVRVVDYTNILTQARAVAPYTVLAPAGLPAGWRATSGDYEPPQVTGRLGVSMWHVGYVTPDNEYAGVEQGNIDLRSLLEDQLDHPEGSGTSVVNGRTWTRYVSADGSRRALTATVAGSSVVVHGTAGWADLERMAGALSGGG